VEAYRLSAYCKNQQNKEATGAGKFERGWIPYSSLIKERSGERRQKPQKRYNGKRRDTSQGRGRGEGLAAEGERRKKGSKGRGGTPVVDQVVTALLGTKSTNTPSGGGESLTCKKSGQKGKIAEGKEEFQGDSTVTQAEEVDEKKIIGPPDILSLMIFEMKRHGSAECTKNHAEEKRRYEQNKRPKIAGRACRKHRG